MSRIKPHVGQQEVLGSLARFKVVAAGRRWGKDELIRFAVEQQMTDIQGQMLLVGPNLHLVDYQMRQLDEMLERDPGLYLYTEVFDYFRLWDLATSRPHSIDLLLLNEPGFADEPIPWPLLEKLMRPETGKMLAVGTPMIRRGQQPIDLLRELFSPGFIRRDGWQHWHFKTTDNPLIDAEEKEYLHRVMSEASWRSEIQADWVDLP